MQQFLTAFVAFVFSLAVLISGYSAESPSLVIGVFGILAALTVLVHARSGLIALCVPAGMALLASITVDASFLAYAAAYGLMAFMAWRIARGQAEERRQRQEARARDERMDRYVRQQLGE